MTHDEIIKNLQDIKQRKELTYAQMAKPTKVKPGMVRHIMEGGNGNFDSFLRITKTYGIDISLKKIRNEIFQSINNSDKSMEDISEESGVSKLIISQFLIKSNTKLYYIMDLMEQFNLEF